MAAAACCSHGGRARSARSSPGSAGSLGEVAQLDRAATLLLLSSALASPRCVKEAPRAAPVHAGASAVTAASRGCVRPRAGSLAAEQVTSGFSTAVVVHSAVLTDVTMCSGRHGGHTARCAQRSKWHQAADRGVQRRQQEQSKPGDFEAAASHSVRRPLTATQPVLSAQCGSLRCA